MHPVTDRRVTRLRRDLGEVFTVAHAICDLHRASPSERTEYIERQRQHCNSRMTYAPSAFANIRAMARERRDYLTREVAYAAPGGSQPQFDERDPGTLGPQRAERHD